MVPQLNQACHQILYLVDADGADAAGVERPGPALVDVGAALEGISGEALLAGAHVAEPVRGGRLADGVLAARVRRAGATVCSVVVGKEKEKWLMGALVSQYLSVT